MNPFLSPLAPIAAAGFLLLAAVPAGAADLPKELSTAITHAGMAAGAADLKMVQTHLHHVVNCLVGPNGAGFDAAPGNPCKDQGAGAIPDSSPDKQKILQTALASAESGIAETDIVKAKADATEAQAAIKKAE
jgi:hypothetical protein